MKIHAYDRTIAQIFSQNVKYIIPRFQREYSWGIEEVREFWEDVLGNIEEDTLKNKEYFIGSLVLVEENEYTYHVVDGQQRLTTITLFFSALIEAFKEFDKGLAEGLYNFVEGKDLNAKAYFKLINENPKPFLQKSIQNIEKETIKPTSTEEKKIENAYKQFKNNLSQLRKDIIDDNQYNSYLIAIRDQILSLKTIFISVDSMEEAYTIFETLNSKGISLSTTDLIKNDVFKTLNYEHPNDDAKEIWKEIISNSKTNPKETDISVFIRHYWLSKYEFLNSTRLYKAYKKLNLDNKEKMQNFLNELYEESIVYKKIGNPDINDWRLQEEKDIYYTLEALNLFKVTQLKTVLLALFAQYKNKLINVTELKKALRLLENFHFIFTAISSERPSGLEQKYSTISRKIRKATTKPEVRTAIDELKTYLASKVSSKSTFEKGFNNLSYSNNNENDKKLIQYIFRRFEENLHGTDELRIGNITLEHISPQRDGVVGFDSIGNLIPLDKKLNELADTKAFKDKLPILNRSNLKFTTEFVKKNNEKSQWGEADIQEQLNELINKAYDEIWKI
ncbi:DUF262 domain-containing protein [Lysinibacillus capsici]|uniref:DUF262 domain-containing protein n=1 Tax=Lysinibacillus capsici TaxID=2115968 RepID=UPI00382B3587